MNIHEKTYKLSAPTLLMYWEGNVVNILVIYGKFTNIFNFKNREEKPFKTEKQFPKQIDQTQN